MKLQVLQSKFLCESDKSNVLCLTLEGLTEIGMESNCERRLGEIEYVNCTADGSGVLLTY